MLQREGPATYFRVSYHSKYLVSLRIRKYSILNTSGVGADRV